MSRNFLDLAFERLENHLDHRLEIDNIPPVAMTQKNLHWKWLTLAMDFRWPLFVNQANKWWVTLATGVVAGLLYMSTHRFHLAEPRLLPMTALDKAVPLVPWTVWIYISEYLLFVLAVALSRNMDNLSRFFYSFAFLQVASFSVFWLYPVTFPRELYPLTDVSSLTGVVFHSLRTIDAPTNCLPSLHVGSCLLFAMLFYRESRPKFIFFICWALLIGVSTLTTKQHYLADVVLGAVFAVTFYFVGYSVLKYAPPTSRSVAGK